MAHSKIHYGWVILAIGILVVAGALGFGRFSYGMILPSMQKGLGLTHSETGLIASANMLGYLLASLVAGMLSSRYGPRLVITLSLFWTGLTMGLTSLINGINLLILIRFLTGLGSAGSNVSMMGLSSSWFSSRRRGMANGFLVGGSGLAITFSGWLIPWLNELSPEQGWRFAWVLLGCLVLAVGFLAFWLVRNHPAEKKLAQMGADVPCAPAANLSSEKLLNTRDLLAVKGSHLLTLAYFCFGMSYVIYTMFFVNYLVGERGFDQLQAGNLWSLVGFLSIGSALIWGTLSDLIGRPLALAMVFTLQAVCYLIPALAPSAVLIWSSAVIFGLTAWSIPGIVASFCGDLVGPRNAPAALGLITFFFGVGQFLGPAVAGYFKDMTQSFAGSFYLATLLACTGAVCALLLSRFTAGHGAVRQSCQLK